MKTSTIVALSVGLILVALTGCQSLQKREQHSTMCPYCNNMENDLADKIIQALKEKSKTKFKALLPNSALIHQYCASMDLSPGKKQKSLSCYLKKIKNNENEILKSFTTVLNEGERRGILWRQIKLKSIEGLVRFDIKTRSTRLRLALIVACLGKEYTIYVDDCEFILGEYYIMRPIMMEPIMLK